MKYPPPKSLMLWWHVVMKIEYKMKHHIWKKDSWKNPAILFIGGRGWENFFPSQILPLPTGRYIMFSDMTSFVIQNFMTSSVICLKVLVLCSAWIEDELCSVCWSIALLMQFLSNKCLNEYCRHQKDWLYLILRWNLCNYIDQLLTSLTFTK